MSIALISAISLLLIGTVYVFLKKSSLPQIQVQAADMEEAKTYAEKLWNRWQHCPAFSTREEQLEGCLFSIAFAGAVGIFEHKQMEHMTAGGLLIAHFLPFTEQEKQDMHHYVARRIVNYGMSLDSPFGFDGCIAALAQMAERAKRKKNFDAVDVNGKFKGIYDKPTSSQREELLTINEKFAEIVEKNGWLYEATDEEEGEYLVQLMEKLGKQFRL